MSTATLTIDLDAISANWRALDAMSEGETAAVVKANAVAPHPEAIRVPERNISLLLLPKKVQSCVKH